MIHRTLYIATVVALCVVGFGVYFRDGELDGGWVRWVWWSFFALFFLSLAARARGRSAAAADEPVGT